MKKIAGLVALALSCGLLFACGDDRETAVGGGGDTAISLGSEPPGRFLDNGNGTITDKHTGLMWESKTEDGDVHDLWSAYTWSSRSSMSGPTGTVFTSFLAKLNDAGGGTCPSGGPTGGCCPNATCTDDDCFADHCDWRLPTIEELRSPILTGGCGETGQMHCVSPVWAPVVDGYTNEFYWSFTQCNHDRVVLGQSFGDGGETTVGSLPLSTGLARAVRGPIWNHQYLHGCDFMYEGR